MKVNDRKEYITTFRDVGFEVPTKAVTKSCISRDLMLCSSLKVSLHLEVMSPSSGSKNEPREKPA
jgi:hypothetical protein